MMSLSSIGVEQEIWSGTSSHIVNFTTYATCAIVMTAIVVSWKRLSTGHFMALDEYVNYLLLLLILPMSVIIWQWIALKSKKYQLTTQRLMVHSGVLNKSTDILELYRVRDYRIEHPFYLRLFSAGNITLMTSDRCGDHLALIAIEKPEELRELIRTQVELCRDRKRVREINL